MHKHYKKVNEKINEITGLSLEEFHNNTMNEITKNRFTNEYKLDAAQILIITTQLFNTKSSFRSDKSEEALLEECLEAIENIRKYW